MCDYRVKIHGYDINKLVRNYEGCSEEKVLGIAELVFEAFCRGNVSNIPTSEEKAYDVKYLEKCIEEKLTAFESNLLFLRYGLDDGRKKTFTEVGSRIRFTRQWTAESVHIAERKLLYWWHQYPNDK